MNNQAFLTFVSSMYLLFLALVLGNIIMSLSVKNYDEFYANQIAVDTKKSLYHDQCIKGEINCNSLKFSTNKSEIKALKKRYNEMYVTKKEFEKLREELKNSTGKIHGEIKFDHAYASVIISDKVIYRLKIKGPNK